MAPRTAKRDGVTHGALTEKPYGVVVSVMHRVSPPGYTTVVSSAGMALRSQSSVEVTVHVWAEAAASRLRSIWLSSSVRMMLAASSYELWCGGGQEE